ncbi:srebf1 [Bugula neritina]|uniref:Srebf1 n=1 Tax=Bugula neritina TaxID=10212 RepID=A0A7J7K3N6_BUGNE|nr:srebf1 [Bugula neritina]
MRNRKCDVELWEGCLYRPHFILSKNLGRLYKVWSCFSPETLLPESPPYFSGGKGRMTPFPHCSPSLLTQSTLPALAWCLHVLDSHIQPVQVIHACAIFDSQDSSFTAGLTAGSSMRSSRTLQGYTDSISDYFGIWNYLIPSALLWVMNILVVSFVLTKVLVYGEPVTTSGSKESAKYWRHLNQSESDLKNGSGN